jgi:3-oxoacyl-[acyl-carrier protein] reductase
VPPPTELTPLSVHEEGEAVNWGLQGKRVLVTGGTQGIGRAVTLALAEAGASVVAAYRENAEAAARLEKELQRIGGDHRTVRADVSTQEGAGKLAQACEQTLGGLDGLVNNAGVLAQHDLETLPVTEWHRVLDTNLTSMFLVSQAVLPLLADRASVVNIGAAAALRGRAGLSHYTASKAAVTGFGRSLCKEFGPERAIRVNTVAPGIVRDPAEELPPQLKQQVRGMIALGRLGAPEEVAGAALYLLSDLSTYVTGTTINVDGGM